MADLAAVHGEKYREPGLFVASVIFSGFYTFYSPIASMHEKGPPFRAALGFS
jgi:hypothetical protein